VTRWVARAEATGSPAASLIGGSKPFALADQADWIRARLAEKPDLTGREPLAELHERKIDVSYYGVWHFVTNLGLSLKKRRAPANKTAAASPGAVRNGSVCKVGLMPIA